MDFKLIGSILLIVGTSIGAGMLALPLATAQLGFFSTILLLIGCWAIMTSGAFLLLEANTWTPLNSNLVSMAKITLGPVGQMIAWLTYLLLLYSLLSAYIAGGSDLLHNFLTQGRMDGPEWVFALVFTLIFGSIVYLGIRAVDYTNRGLMIFKFGAYFILILLLVPFVSVEKWQSGSLAAITSATAITVSITSFGYATIIPSLRIYFAGNLKKLKLAILIGSLIPLVCYIFWVAVIMGILPLEGAQGLLAILKSDNSTSDLVNNLNQQVGTVSVSIFVKLFTSVCVLTSFLGVSLCLVDFLADGFNLEKTSWSNIFLNLLTFFPPFLIVVFFPKAFIGALKYAGVYCLILLVLLPVWMVWRGRYHLHMPQTFKTWGGKPLLLFLFLFSALMIVRGLFNS